MLESPRLSGKCGLRLIKSHKSIEIARVDSIDDRLKDLLRRACRNINLRGVWLTNGSLLTVY
jgi:hypothetical protein